MDEYNDVNSDKHIRDYGYNTLAYIAIITEVNFKCIKYAIFIKCDQFDARHRLGTVVLIFLLMIMISIQLLQIHVYLIHELISPYAYDRGIFKMPTVEWVSIRFTGYELLITIE